MGAPFSGWQIQPNAPSIQEEIQEKLSLLLGESTQIYGAGRTDSGVHAEEMFAHFDFDKRIDRQDLTHRLNKFLPPEIAIQEIYPVQPDAHARFSAMERTYKYLIEPSKNPFHEHSHWYVPGFNFSLDQLNEIAGFLMEYDDFASFARSHAAHKTTICELKWVNWELQEGCYIFTISANRFLRNMVRAIVGSLVEVAKGRWDLHQWRQIIEKKDRSLAGSSAPAHGLYLYKIKYPSEIFQ